MHYVEAGAGEPVILLHGFPECWFSWRNQIEALAPNYRAVAPDLRGYHETEARGPYDTDTLQGDVLGLIETLGERSAHIVGHDWGRRSRVAARHPPPRSGPLPGDLQYPAPGALSCGSTEFRPAP